jgi:hypothetical protein
MAPRTRNFLLVSAVACTGLMLLIAPPSDEAPQPSESRDSTAALHGNGSTRLPLRISANGRYLEGSDGTPFLYFGDTAWLLNRHSGPDIDRLLDDRVARGFTVIKITSTGLNAEYRSQRHDAAGNLPFIGRQITRFNEAWWERLRAIIRKCADRNLVVEFTIGGPGRNEANLIIPPSKRDLYEYGQKIGSLMRNERNIIYNIGQDTHAEAGAGFDGWRAIAEGVADGVNGRNQFDGEADYGTTLMTFHPAGNEPYTSSHAFHCEPWLDFNGVEVFHQNSRVHGAILSDYQRSPAKPVILIEGSYEADGHEQNNPGVPITLRYIRQEAWHAFFAGAAGYVYGHRDNYAQTANIDYIRSPGMEQLRVLREFLDAREWWKWVPDSTLASSLPEANAAKLAAVRSTDGDEACIYFPAAMSAEVALKCITASNRVRAAWLDPRNGNIEPLGTFANTETLRPEFPVKWEDAVLMLNAVRDDSSPSPSPPPAR